MSDSTARLFGTGPVFPVPDVAAAARYYCETLGFDHDFVMEGHASVTRDRVGIQFTQTAMPYAAASFPGWTYIFTENIDALFAEYQARGVQVTRPLTSHAHGMREFQVADCHGFQLRFGQYLEK